MRKLITGCVLLPLLLCGAAPVAVYGPATGYPHMTDLTIKRLADGSQLTFRLTGDGSRDTAAIDRFLVGGWGRVVRLFDHVAHHDLIPVAGTVGPMVVPGIDVGSDIGLRFDNDGAFEGNPTALGKPLYAVSLGTAGVSLDVRHGMTVIATARLGNIVSTAVPEMLCFGCRLPYPLLLLAGDGDPALPRHTADDVAILHGRSYPAAPPLASTPDIVAVAFDSHGVDGLAGGAARTSTVTISSGEHFSDMMLGTVTPGGGAGWEFARLEVYDRRLSRAELLGARTRLEAQVPSGNRGTLVLDGSSVEAGMGSTGMNNLTRLYEHGLSGIVIYNVAIGGAKTSDRLLALPATLGLFPDDGRPAVLLCGIGANSLGSGVSASAAYAQLTAYVALAHRSRTGLLVGVTTLIPNGPAIDYGYGDQFGIYNRLVAGNQAGADFVVDRAADKIMGDPSRYRPSPDQAISADGAHPTDAGTSILAKIDLTALRRVLGLTSKGTAQPPSTSLR